MVPPRWVGDKALENELSGGRETELSAHRLSLYMLSCAVKNRIIVIVEATSSSSKVMTVFDA
jgi:hypothetical protein